MKIKRILPGLLMFAALITSSQALSSPMEGVDSVTQSKPYTYKPDGEKQQSQGLNGLVILSLLLGLSGAGVGVMAFIKNNKTEIKNVQQKNIYDKDATAMKAEIARLSTSVSDLTSQLFNIKRELEKRPAAGGGLDAHTFNSGVHTGQSNPTNSSYAPPQQASVSQQPIKQYFGTPVQGTFSNPTSNYVNGKSLYCLTGISGSNTAQYSYVETPVAASIASRSISQFVETGCMIQGEVRNNFSKVVTVKPGTVVRTPAGWKIESKAVVKFV